MFLSTPTEQNDFISKEELYAYFLYSCFNSVLSDGSSKNLLQRVTFTGSGPKWNYFSEMLCQQILLKTKMKPLKNVERDINWEGESTCNRERLSPSSPIFVVYHSINDSIHLFGEFGWVGWQLLRRRSASSFLCFLSILLPRIFIHISSSLPFFKPDFLFHFFQIAVFNCLTTMGLKSMIKQKTYCKGK